LSDCGKSSRSTCCARFTRAKPRKRGSRSRASPSAGNDNETLDHLLS
jgi:hypothetical protein